MGKEKGSVPFFFFLVLGEIREGECERDDHRSQEHPDHAEGEKAAQHPNEDRERRHDGPAGDQQGFQEVVHGADNKTNHCQHDRGAVAALEQQRADRRHPDQRRAAEGHDGQHRADHAEHDGRGEADHRKASAEQQPLDHRGHDRAEHNRSGHRSEPVLQLVAPPWFERHEIDRCARHPLAVADEKEQQEQHHGEIQDRAEGAEQRRAAECGELFKRALRALEQPGLGICRADAGVPIEPFEYAAEQRQAGEIGDPLALMLFQPVLEQDCEASGLLSKSNGERRERADEHQQHENRQQ